MNVEQELQGLLQARVKRNEPMSYIPVGRAVRRITLLSPRI